MRERSDCDQLDPAAEAEGGSCVVWRADADRRCVFNWQQTMRQEARARWRPRNTIRCVGAKIEKIRLFRALRRGS